MRQRFFFALPLARPAACFLRIKLVPPASQSRFTVAVGPDEKLNRRLPAGYEKEESVIADRRWSRSDFSATSGVLAGKPFRGVQFLARMCPAGVQDSSATLTPCLDVGGRLMSLAGFQH